MNQYPRPLIVSDIYPWAQKATESDFDYNLHRVQLIWSDGQAKSVATFANPCLRIIRSQFEKIGMSNKKRFVRGPIISHYQY